jgi:hypothetical protein
MNGSECDVLLQRGVVITEKYNVTVHSEELIGTKEYLGRGGGRLILRQYIIYV